MKKTEKSPTEVKKKILDAATKKFAKNGYKKTSMNEIVNAAKVSKGSLFYHYHSKEELFFVVLSKSIDLAFQRIYELFSQKDFQLFQKRERLLEDLKEYYDIVIDKPKDFERIWFEGAIESENNSKLRRMLIKKDNEVAAIIAEMLKNSRMKIGILKGYNDTELLELSRGLTALFRGVFLDKITGKDPKEIKNTWAQTTYIIYNSKK